jgi:hypothetical protein
MTPVTITSSTLLCLCLAIQSASEPVSKKKTEMNEAKIAKPTATRSHVGRSSHDSSPEGAPGGEILRNEQVVERDAATCVLRTTLKPPATQRRQMRFRQSLYVALCNPFRHRAGIKNKYQKDRTLFSPVRAHIRARGRVGALPGKLIRPLPPTTDIFTIWLIVSCCLLSCRVHIPSRYVLTRQTAWG